MDLASKRKSVFAWLFALLIVSGVFGENRAWAFFDPAKTVPGQIEAATPEAIGENSSASRYDAPGYAVAPRSGGTQLVLHQDQVIINNYQRYYNDAWTQTVKRFNAGDISIPAGMHWKTVLGQHADAAARARLRNFLTREGIPEGHGADVLVNRWLRDPLGSGAYRIPDLRLQQTGTILDGTIGSKTMNSPQIQDFINFSGGNRVIIVRPTVGPTP